MMVNKIIPNVIIIFLLFLTMFCSRTNGNSDDYQSSAKPSMDSLNLYYSIVPDTIELGDTAILTIVRKSMRLEKLRGVIGKYDSSFNLLEGAKEHVFYGNDYSASISLVPRSSRTHTYRGFMEEYEILNDSIEKLFRHAFEVKLVVLDP